MTYFYRNHTRNLEEEALLEREKIHAELYEKELMNSRRHEKIDQHDKNAMKRSRRQEDKETAAFLQRSRLSAQLSATRLKAENSMTRSRLQTAFNLRKQNQTANQQIQRMNNRHAHLRQLALKEEVIATNNYSKSVQMYQQKAIQQNYLKQAYLRQYNRAQIQCNYIDRLAQIEGERLYNYPYYPYQ